MSDDTQEKASKNDLDIVTISLKGGSDNSPLEFVSADLLGHFRDVEEAAADVVKTKRAFDSACDRLMEAMSGAKGSGNQGAQ